MEFQNTKDVPVGDQIVAGGEHPLFLIAGPCGIESKSLAHDVAGRLSEITDAINLPFVFKSSYDKANRTSIDSFRGPGLEKGLRILEEVKEAEDVPVLSDIHCQEHAEPAAEVLDVLQIPAFLCRQTDLVRRAASTGRTLNVKKGQFLEPSDAKYIVEKAESEGNGNVLLTERGSCFGHGDLVNDFRSIPIMQQTANVPVVYDATHSAQQPGSEDHQTGGTREFIPAMTRAAVAAGCNGLFMETHPDPDQAKSDAATQYPLDKMSPFLESIVSIRDALSK